MSLPFHPIVLLAACCALAAVVVLVLLLRLKHGGARLVLGLLLFLLLTPPLYVAVGLYPWLVDARFRTYRAFYRDIAPGMTRAEVMALLDRHYPPGGARLRPTILHDSETDLAFFMNPERSREPNCEGIFLAFRDGRVSTRRYSAD